MTVPEVFYHVSHEQFRPRHLLELVQAAEAAGFDGAFSSDHLNPWSSSQGNSGFAWSWLGAALQATRRLSFSTITTPIGLRYHPVITAQALATLADLYGERVNWVALGSGEALNEHALGLGWPSKAERRERLKEAAGILRRLLQGETVSAQGHVNAIDAKLWCPPRGPLKLFGAAVSEESAEWMAPWTDGLLTAGIDADRVASIVEAYRRGGGAGKPVHLKVDLSWHGDEAQALEQAHANWRFNALEGDLCEELRTPAEFEARASSVTREDMRRSVVISSSLEEYCRRLQELAETGVEILDLHNVGLNQEDFIRAFGPLLERIRS